jgi:hypothetical protein
MAGVFKGYLFNGFARIMHQVPYFAVPFATGTCRLSHSCRAMVAAVVLRECCVCTSIGY